MKKQVGSCLIALMLIISLPLSLSAKEVCEMILTGCPESYNGDTIVVPEKVVALSSSMLACSTSISATVSTTSPPPSIMIVIDHSSSMSGATGDRNDQRGARFTVTKEFIDSIYSKQPKAEVGVVVFAGHLFFNTDTSTTEYYRKYFVGVPDIIDSASSNQAYAKMLTLDSTYDGKKGIDILKDILATKDSIVNQMRDSVIIRSDTITELKFEPNFKRTGTDINLGFYAAKNAFKTAKYAKDRQFVIFFSDGEPNGTLLGAADDFISGKDMPTTFTVYFTKRNLAPASIASMTDNIKVNGYSEANKNSGLWAIQANHEALLNLLMTEAMKTIIITTPPSHMVINGVTSLTTTDTTFQFQDKFALAAVNTDFDAKIVYEYTNPAGDKKDSIIKLHFVIKRSGNVPLPADVNVNCWEQPSLQFYYDNRQISEAEENMTQLQIRLIPNGETIDSAKVELKSSLESMPVTLSKNGTYWQKTFTRETKASASNDDILQHIPADSIIAIYRNPNLPMDTVRTAIPVRVHPRIIPVTAILLDTSGNGHIDRIDLIWPADTFDIIKNLPSVSVFVLNTQITTTDGTVIKLTPGSVIKRHGDTLSIIINETNGKITETGWGSAIVVVSDAVVTEQGNSFRVDKIIDGTGPIIQRILYYPGTGPNPHDTLKITLNTPLNCDFLNSGSPSSSFNYLDEGELDPGMFSGASFIINCESGYVAEVRVILNSNGLVTPEEDSMNIIGNSNSVVGKNGNRSNTNNRIVAVEWGIDNRITVAVSNNPFSPGETEINPLVRKHYGVPDDQKMGTIVSITSIKPFQKLSDGSYGSAVIYDALGNLIRQGLLVQKTKTGNFYFARWDGRNKNNRAVGDGTYLLILTSSINGNKYVKKTKIGVSVKF